MQVSDVHISPTQVLLEPIEESQSLGQSFPSALDYFLLSWDQFVNELEFE